MSEAVKGGERDDQPRISVLRCISASGGAASIADFTDRAVGGPLQCYFNLLALQTSL